MCKKNTIKTVTHAAFAAGLCSSGLLAFDVIASDDIQTVQVETVLNLPSGKMEDALLSVNSAFNVAILASDDTVANKTSPPVNNAKSAEEAITAILKGSGLGWEKTDENTFVITPKLDTPKDDTRSETRSYNLSKNIEVITVTALKRESFIQDVPVSLTVFDSTDIFSRNILTFEDFALPTPNLSFQNNGGSARTLFSLRGVGGGNIASGTGTPVGIYVDEVILNPTGGLRQNDLALFGLERIEILRGPQGTLFGRNTIGGAINLVTKKPNDTFSGRITGGLERFNTKTIQGFINTPITDSLFAQVSGIYRESDGFIENSTNGDTLGKGGEGGRVALRYLPNSNLTIDISAVINKVTYDGLQGIAEESFNNGEFSVPLPFQIENFVDSELYIGRIEYNASAFDIISLSSYNEFDALETFDVTGLFGPFNAFLEILTTQENLSQEFRIQSNNSTDSAYRWIAGINYFKTDDLIGQTGITGTPNNRMQSLATLFISGEAENTSAFFSVDMDLGNDFIFTLGGRYSRDDYERISNDGTLFPGSNSAFTPSFTLKYKHSENVLLYSTISKGYRPGSVDISFVDLNPDDQFTSEYDPETAWNYEIGANASLFEGKLVGRANLFFMDYKDIQSVFFIPPSNLSTVTTNGASAEIYGAEIEANVYPSDNLSFDVNLGLLETEFTSFADSPRGDLTGNELPYAPSVTIGINGEYRTKLSDDLEGYVRAEFNRRSSQEGRNDNNPIERQPGYDIVNLRAGVYYANMNIEVYGENVFDEEYFTNRRPGPIVSVTPGSPATWGVRVTATF